MKILLDENLPKKLKISFINDHKVFTVGKVGWNGKKNGELLGLMTINGFDVFVTMDKNLKFQQNIEKFPIQIFILNALNNKLDTLKPYVKKFSGMLGSPSDDKIVEVTFD